MWNRQVSDVQRGGLGGGGGVGGEGLRKRKRPHRRPRRVVGESGKRDRGGVGVARAERARRRWWSERVWGGKRGGWRRRGERGGCVTEKNEG